MTKRNNKDSNCEVVRGEVDLSKYEKLDGEWREMGLAAPARRALVNAKILKLKDLKKWSLEDLSKLHAMGPSALKTLKSEMKKEGLKFKA
jgi:hypothetical protein